MSEFQSYRAVLLFSFLLFVLSLFGAPRAHAKTSIKSQISLYENRLKLAPENIRLREKLAELYNKAKMYEKTIVVLAPYSNETTIKGLIDLAEAYQFSKDPLNEVRTLQILLIKEPKRFRPHYLLGQAYERNSQLKEAIEQYRLSVGYARKHLPSYNAMLKIFQDQNNFYEARLVVQDKIKNVGERKEFLNELCELYAKDGFLNEGVVICQKAIKMDPQHESNHIYLARSYANQQKKEVAQKIFTNAAKRFKNSEFVQWATGEFFFQEANYPAAVRYLTAAIKVEKTSARSQLGLALSLFEISSYEKALNTYITSCQHDKTNESLMALRTAIARLRQENKNSWADKFTKKEHLCRSEL